MELCSEEWKGIGAELQTQPTRKERRTAHEGDQVISYKTEIGSEEWNGIGAGFQVQTLAAAGTSGGTSGDMRRYK